MTRAAASLKARPRPLAGLSRLRGASPRLAIRGALEQSLRCRAMLRATARRTKGIARRARRKSRLLADRPEARMKLMAPLLRPYWRMRFHSFGARSICWRPYWLEGPGKISVGDDAALLGAWLAVGGQAWKDPDPTPRLQIGNGVVVLPFGRITAFESVVIEDYVAIAVGCLVGDAEHTKTGSWDLFAQGPLETAPIRIGRGTLLGGRLRCSRGRTSVSPASSGPTPWFREGSPTIR